MKQCCPAGAWQRSNGSIEKANVYNRNSEDEGGTK